MYGAAIRRTATSLAKRRRALNVPLLLGLFAVLAAMLNPLGYVGGGFDDWQYLIAAECWSQHGACLPHDHWSSRWTLVAPVAAVIGTLGEGRLALQLVPFAFAVGAVLLLAHIVTRRFGRAEALIAGTLLLVTPVFTLSMTTLNIDTIELAFLIAALAAWLRAIETRAPGWALLAGGSLALAFQTRETAIVYAALLGYWFLRLGPAERRVQLWSIPGFVIPTTIPIMLHTWFAGDALLRYRLAFAHSGIASDELRPGVELSGSPLFNPAAIGSWVPSNGIDLHWTIDPIVNLLTHPQIGLTFVALVVLAGPQIGSKLVPSATMRPVALAIAGTAAVALILAYGLALDPKPRMFLPMLAAFCVGAAVLGVAAWRQGRRLFGGILACLALLQSVAVILRTTPITASEQAAERWLTDATLPVATSETTRRHLALVPQARALPAVLPPTGGLWLEQVRGECTRWFLPADIVAAQRLRADYPRLAALFRSPTAAPDPADYWLCLVRQADARPVG